MIGRVIDKTFGRAKSLVHLSNLFVVNVISLMVIVLIRHSTKQLVYMIQLFSFSSYQGNY